MMNPVPVRVVETTLFAKCKPNVDPRYFEHPPKKFTTIILIKFTLFEFGKPPSEKIN